MCTGEGCETRYDNLLQKKLIIKRNNNNNNKNNIKPETKTNVYIFQRVDIAWLSNSNLVNKKNKII